MILLVINQCHFKQNDPSGKNAEDEEEDDQDVMDFAPGGDADYFAEEDDEGRFFGGGLTKEQKDNFDQWIYKNGLRWTAEGGPLAAGGVDVAFIGEREFEPSGSFSSLLNKMIPKCRVSFP